MAWYGALAVHELGHCVGAWISGGAVARVELPLFGFSQTHYADNPAPLFAAWAGPVAGALFGVVTLGLAFWVGGRVREVALFFAGFSLLLNGAYLGFGGFLQVGDCGDLLRHGARLWELVAFGVVAGALGVYCWHRMGPVRRWFGQEPR